jgi:hypothetical protein
MASMRIFKLLFSFLLVFNVVVLSGGTAKAEEIQSTNEKITVVPAKFELWGKPGQTIEQSLKITNEDTEDAIIALSVQGFGLSAETGEVVIGQTENGYPDQLSKWITFSEKSSQFAPKETKLISFKIAIPKIAPAGGRYGTIVVGMDRVSRNVKESGASAKVVSLLMLSVAGDITQETAIKSFKAIKNSSGGYDFILRAENNGNSHIKPKGTIVISNVWGQKIDEIALNSENVLPKMARKITTSWKPSKYLAGFYTATLVSSYGDSQNQQLNTSTAFLVFSRSMVIFCTILLFSLAALAIYALLKLGKIKKEKLLFWKKR